MLRPSRRTLIVHLISLTIAALVGGYACSRQADPTPPDPLDDRVAPLASGAAPLASASEPAPLASAGVAPLASAAPSASVASGRPRAPGVPAPRGSAGFAWPRRPGVAVVGVAPGSSAESVIGAPGASGAAVVGAAPGVAIGAPGAGSAAALIGAPASSGGPPDGKADKPEPIDLAIAPKGGVPFHPEGTSYRSPFAKPNPGAGVRVKVATTLNSLDEYDIKTGKFTADFYLSLTSAEAMPKLTLQVTNGTIDKQNTLADKPTFKLYRMSGTFKSPPDLRKYPFDSQELKIVLEDDQHGTDQVRLVVDRERTSLARGFRAVGWQVNSVQARSLSVIYGDRFEGDDLYYGRYVVSVSLERYANSATFKVFCPAFVIVLISVLGMWVPAEEMEVRSNTGAPMLASAVLFHYSLMQDLPATSYFMRADKLMLGVYLSLLFGMISTWLMFLVKERHIEHVFRISRVAVPLLVVITMFLACFL